MKKEDVFVFGPAGILMLLSIAYADFGSSSNYRIGVDVGAYSEAGASASYGIVVESALSADRGSSSSYQLSLGWTAAASLVSATDDTSFTIYVPANNPSGVDSSEETPTGTLTFNITDVNAKKVNASTTSGSQTDIVAIFRYENTGTVPLTIKLNFTAAVPAQIVVKAGWSDSSYEQSCTSTTLTGTGTCANITEGGAAQAPVTVASVASVGTTRDVWLWADYNDWAAGSDTTANIGHSSTK